MRIGLHDIAQSAATDGQVPGWDDLNGLWVPSTVVRGLTSGDASVAITDNGDGTLDLAAAGGGGGAAFVGAKVYRSAAYSLANNAVTMMPWDAEEWDTDGFHDNVTNNTRLTVPSGKAGKYAIKANIGTDAAAATYPRFIVGFQINGTTIPRGATTELNIGNSNTFPMLSMTADLNLAVGDYVECFYFQTCGTTRNFYNARCAMSIYKTG